MRIDLSNSAASQVMSDQNAQRVSTNGAARTGIQDPGDRATLSSNSLSLKSLVSASLNTPEVRQDKVDSLRHALSAGQYQLDPAQIASSIVDEHA